jgi:hypothetical protein
MAIAIICSASGYALMGPVRAIAFPNLLIILMFGMFGLRAASSLWHQHLCFAGLWPEHGFDGFDQSR